MKNGDISNESPKRILVHTDVFTRVTSLIKKKFKILPVVSKNVEFDRTVLSRLYLFAGDSGITLEMISYDLTQDHLNLLHAELDRWGTNPFRYATHFWSPRELMAQLPYRPEVLGVCDVPSRQLMYGHWSYTLL